MIIVLGTLDLANGDADSARALLDTLVTQTRAEDGCIDYAFAIDVLDKGRLRISEKWRDRPALDAHLESAHLAAFREGISKIGLSGSDVQVFEADAGRPL